MVRSVRGQSLKKSLSKLPARVILPALIGLAAAGCSSDVTRFDFPSFGLTDAHPRSKPIPSQSVYQQTVDGGAVAGQGVASDVVPDYGDPGVGYGTPDYGGYGAPKKKYEVSGLPPTKGGGGVDGDQFLNGQGGYANDAVGNDTPYKPRKKAGLLDGGAVVVQPGDTLYRIARQNNVSVAALMVANNLSSPAISTGMRLVIPDAGGGVEPLPRVKQAKAVDPYADDQSAAMTDGPAYEPAAPADSAGFTPAPKVKPNAALLAKDGTYKVKGGDTLYSISKSLGVSGKELAAANGVNDTFKLREGQILRMPGQGYDSVDSSDDPYGSLKAEKVAALDQSANDPVADHGGDDGRPVKQVATARKKPGKAKSIEQEPLPGASKDGANDGGYGVDNTPDPFAEDGATVEPAARKKIKVAKAEPDADASAVVASKGDNAVADGGGFRWPVRGRIVAPFGKKDDGSQNDGINVAVPLGTEVHAAEEGTVAYAGSELKGYGNLVLIRHADNWVTAYAHNQELLVKRGDKVSRGQVIARAGKSGSVNQPQVHFELRKGSKPVDPMPHMASN